MIVETTAHPNGNGINDNKHYSVNTKTQQNLKYINYQYNIFKIYRYSSLNYLNNT